MERQKNTQMVVIAVLAVAILVMSVGFAVYSSNITIGGKTTAKAASWKVNLDPATFVQKPGSENITKTIEGTSMTYSAILPKPGSFCEFSIDVKNTGTFDAALKSLTMSALDPTDAKYLTYEVTYGTETYTESNLSLNVPLAAVSGTETVNVKVSYVQPENEAELPTSDKEVELTLTLGYEQAE